jgi:hypothetical protein
MSGVSLGSHRHTRSEISPCEYKAFVYMNNAAHFGIACAKPRSVHNAEILEWLNLQICDQNKPVAIGSMLLQANVKGVK